METTCHASYALNSENASPFGTFRVYLSCAEMAQPPTKANTHTIIAIAGILLLFIISTFFAKFRGPTFQVYVDICAISLCVRPVIAQKTMHQIGLELNFKLRRNPPRTEFVTTP